MNNKSYEYYVINGIYCVVGTVNSYNDYDSMVLDYGDCCTEIQIQDYFVDDMLCF